MDRMTPEEAADERRGRIHAYLRASSSVRRSGHVTRTQDDGTTRAHREEELCKESGLARICFREN